MPDYFVIVEQIKPQLILWKADEEWLAEAMILADWNNMPGTWRIQETLLIQSDNSLQTRMGYTICMGMSGSGVRITMIRRTILIVLHRILADRYPARKG